MPKQNHRHLAFVDAITTSHPSRHLRSRLLQLTLDEGQASHEVLLFLLKALNLSAQPSELAASRFLIGGLNEPFQPFGGSAIGRPRMKCPRCRHDNPERVRGCVRAAPVRSGSCAFT